MKLNKIFTAIILFIVLLICLCLKLVFDDKDCNIQFFNKYWGMSVEQVKNNLISKDCNIVDEDIGKVSTFIRLNNYDKKVYGSEPSQIFLDFIDVGDGVHRLYYITIMYHDDVDMEKVLKNMEKQLGNSLDSIRQYSPSPNILQKNNLRFYEYSESQSIKLWGDCRISDVVSNDKILQYQKVWDHNNSILNDENWSDFSNNAMLTTIMFSDGNNDILGKGIYFNAYNNLVYLYINGSLPS